MSKTFCTVVNCSVLGDINRLKKIQLLTDINAYDFPSKKHQINFTRTRFLNASYEKQNKIHDEIPTFDDYSVSISDIRKIWMKAKKDA